MLGVKEKGRASPARGRPFGRDDGSGDREGYGQWPNEGGAFSLPTAKMGLWIFLAVPTLLFAAIMSAYIVRMGLPDWKSLPKPGILWVNTSLLLLSSAALQWASISARRGQLKEMRLMLLAGGLLGVFFMGGQVWAWQQLREMGYFMATNPSSSFFYLITALHGLHLMGGLVAWGRAMKNVGARLALPLAQQAAPLQKSAALGIELCTVYWHFLLVVWLVMFGLMMIT
mgnify:CR=1 FL=1